MAEKNGKKRIEYHTENVYGLPKHYFNDPEVAKHMHALTGMKTLHPSHIEHLKAMGHEVAEVPVMGKKMQSGRGSSDGYMARRDPPLPDDNAAIQ